MNLVMLAASADPAHAVLGLAVTAALAASAAALAGAVALHGRVDELRGELRDLRADHEDLVRKTTSAEPRAWTLRVHYDGHHPSGPEVYAGRDAAEAALLRVSGDLEAGWFSDHPEAEGCEKPLTTTRCGRTVRVSAAGVGWAELSPVLPGRDPSW